LSEPLTDSFQVGQWRVEPALNSLSSSGNPALRRTLEPRLMHLLCFLAANPGQVLSREQLVQELWPRVIVNENSLTRAVCELRKQLRLSDAAAIRYLETIPKKGYRLLPEVQPLPSDYRLPVPRTAKRPALALPAGSGVMIFSRAKPLRAPALLALLMLLTTPLATPDFRPGTQLAIGNPPLVYDQVIDAVRQPAAGYFSLSSHAESERSGAAASQSAVAISPDGSSLAYLRQEGELTRIYLGPTSTPQLAVAIFSSNNSLSGLQWSPVGNALLFASKAITFQPTLLESGSPPADLVMLDLDTLSIRVLIDNSPVPRDPTSTV
jgi:DNA-binding winged helix-turn-helix (wHTH) protein